MRAETKTGQKELWCVDTAESLLALKGDRQLRGQCLILDKSDAALGIAEYVGSHGDLVLIDLAALYREKGDAFRRSYINFIGQLNAANASIDWWTHDLTTKNMLATNLGQNIFHTYLAAELLGREDMDILIVVVQDHDLRGQLQRLAAALGVRFVESGSRKSGLKQFVELVPLYLIFYFFRTWVYRWRMRRALRYRSEGRAKTVFASLINDQSFSDKKAYRDVYFGSLLDRIGDDALVFGKLLGEYPKNIEAIRACGARNIVPIEYFLQARDIFACFGRSLANWSRGPQLIGDTSFEGVDVAYLIKKLLSRDNGRNYYTNLLFYYCAKALARAVDIKVFLYPFENRAFEKMYLIAMREAGVKAIGYNHASVTLKHTNLFVADEELSVVPLPDRVVTLGRISRDILAGEAGLPAELVEVGCGLRQAVADTHRLRAKPKKIRNILVILTAEVEEYLGILAFLNRAFPDGEGDNVIAIRPHPVTPLARALERLDLSFAHEDVGAESLQANLDSADVVIYTSSTVGIEALARGVPAVYLDFGDIILTDPLFGLDDFKWSVADPEALQKTLRAIDEMAPAEYEAAQRIAGAYASEYIYSADEAGLARFQELIEV